MHLNKLVDDPVGESVKAIPTDKIDRFYYESGAGIVLPKEIRDKTFEIEFRNRLVKTNLNPIKVDILVLRFCYDLSLKEIVQEMGFNSTSTVLRLLQQSLKYLKEKGLSKWEKDKLS